MPRMSDSTEPVGSIDELATYLGATTAWSLPLHLLRAIEVGGADTRAKLATAFPDLYRVWRVWHSFEDEYPTGQELTTALSLLSIPGVKLFGE
jgi:hypothetical protein